MFTVLLGTGCRIGEALGLRWQDLDYDRRTISINHSLSYYQKPESNKSVLRISKPKTEAGIRTIPMLDVVKDSFEMLYEEQLENGFNETEIDGMSGFIFCNRFGTVPCLLYTSVGIFDRGGTKGCQWRSVCRQTGNGIFTGCFHAQ